MRPGPTEFLWFTSDLPSLTGLDWVFLGFTGFYWVLLGFIEFDWGLLGFAGFSFSFSILACVEFFILVIE